MAFCINCGKELPEGAKFCFECGKPLQIENQTKRKTVFDGVIHKCPNCGEIVNAFELKCSLCGYELRGTKSTSAVKEFALKLEVIESKREYEKPKSLFGSAIAQQNISKTDEQKINLIKSFSVPNSKEDILEFMILATSNINMKTYDYWAMCSKGEKELSDAWFSKVKQVYEKAKRVKFADDTFNEISKLYEECNDKIKRHKKKSVLKWFLALGWIPLLWITIIMVLIFVPSPDEREIERLENIVIKVERALEIEEYNYALSLADTIDYQEEDVALEKKWDIEREYWINKVIEDAAKNGIYLDYTPTEDIDNANKKE